MSQREERGKITARDLGETEVRNMPDKQFKVMIIKILSLDLRKVEDINEALNKKIKKNKSEMKNTITEIKNTLDGLNSRLQETEKQISDLEDRVMESNQAKQVREKKICKLRTVLRNSVIPSSIITFFIIGFLEAEEREKGTENSFEEIIAENFLNLRKKTDIQI